MDRCLFLRRKEALRLQTVLSGRWREQHEQRKKLRIRNSTAEFLIFSKRAGENTIEVRVVDETVWLPQKLMAALFEVSVPTINEHLANFYAQREIVNGSSIRNF